MNIGVIVCLLLLFIDFIVFSSTLRCDKSYKKDMKVISDNLETLITSKSYKNDINYWIPVSERYPDNDSYILLSFSNFSVPCVGRFVSDPEGGAFYVGDEDVTCLSQDLYVNAWMSLPDCYHDEGDIKRV